MTSWAWGASTRRVCPWCVATLIVSMMVEQAFVQGRGSCDMLTY